MQNPAQFIQLQRSLAGDALNEYIHHTGSAVFAVPPGLRPGQHYGDALFTLSSYLRRADRTGQHATRPVRPSCRADGIAQARSLLNLLPSPLFAPLARMHSSGHGTMEPL